MVKAIAAFLNFYYLVRHLSINQDHLCAIQEAINCFHLHQKVFQTTGVHKKGFSLPQQHAMVHYISHIIALSAPSGLCSSITESMHICAVKKPWRRLSCNHPLLQILCTNTRLSKLAAFQHSLIVQGMLGVTCDPDPQTQQQPHDPPAITQTQTMKNQMMKVPHLLVCVTMWYLLIRKVSLMDLTFCNLTEDV